MVQINAEERYAIRFGCFPAQQVKAAVAAGEDELKLCAALAELARRYSGDAVPAPSDDPTAAAVVAPTAAASPARSV